jgi:type II secretion system protein G
MFMKFLKKEKGFTLIELLVVVAIIGVLASIILTSLNDARAAARDARRVSDIRTIQNALELYYLDNNSYPITAWANSNRVSWDNLETILSPYVSELPVDPINTPVGGVPGWMTLARTGGYVYDYFANNGAAWCDGDSYMLIFNKETSDEYTPTSGVTHCTSPTQYFDYDEAFVVGAPK